MGTDERLEDLRFAIEELDTLLRQEEVRLPITRCVVERFKILDEWLSKGGFLPEDWKR